MKENENFEIDKINKYMDTEHFSIEKNGLIKIDFTTAQDQQITKLIKFLEEKNLKFTIRENSISEAYLRLGHKNEETKIEKIEGLFTQILAR